MQAMENTKGIAYYANTVYSGVLILNFIYDVDEYVIFCDEINGKRGKILKSKIRYIKYTKPYFIHYKRKYFLDEFLKIDF